MRKRYVRVKLPEELTDFVAYIATKRLLGFRSMIEFVAYCVRKEVAYLQQVGVVPSVVPKVRTIEPGAIGVLSAVLVVAALGLLAISGNSPTGMAGGTWQDVFSPLAGWNLRSAYHQYAGFFNFALYFMVFFVIVYAATKRRFEPKEAGMLAGAFAVAFATALSLVPTNWITQLSPLVFLIFALGLFYALLEGLRQFGFAWVSSGSLAYVLAYLLVTTHYPDLFLIAGKFGSILHLLFFIAVIAAGYTVVQQAWGRSESVMERVAYAAKTAWQEAFDTPEAKDILLKETSGLETLVRVQTEDFKSVQDLERDLARVEHAIRTYAKDRKALAAVAVETAKLQGQQTELAQRLQDVQSIAQRVRALDVQLFSKVKTAYDKLPAKEKRSVRKVIEQRVAELELHAILPRLAEDARTTHQALNSELRALTDHLTHNKPADALKAVQRASYHAAQLHGLLRRVDDVERAIRDLLNQGLRSFK